MNPAKAISIFVDKIIGVFKFLEEVNFPEKWFTWLEWITVSSAFYAVGKSVNSKLLLSVALFSVVLVFFKAMFVFENTVEKKFHELRNEKKISKMLIWVIAVPLGSFPVLLIIFIGNLISGLILKVP